MDGCSGLSLYNDFFFKHLKLVENFKKLYGLMMPDNKNDRRPLYSSSLEQHLSSLIAISSGKGGVGKTSLSINLGLALSQLGHKVCLFDADANLANINIMLGMTPAYTLEHVLRGERDIKDILMRHAGLSIVPGASGVLELTNLGPAEQGRMIRALEGLDHYFDYLLVDTAAGVGDDVLTFIESTRQCLLVITPEPTSLTDAFSLIRVLLRRGYSRTINVVVNEVNTELSARKVFNRFFGAVKKFLKIDVGYLGFVLQDPAMPASIRMQTPVLLANPASRASDCFRQLAQSLSGLVLEDRPSVDPGNKNETRQLQAVGESASVVAEGHVKPHKLSKRDRMRQHVRALQEYIEDPDLERQDLRFMVGDLVGAFVSRFNDYPFDVMKVISHAIEMDRIPQDKIGRLLMTMQLFYDGHLADVDEQTSAQHIRHLVNSFVQAHKSYPFDFSHMLHHYLSSRQATEHEVRNLLLTLHVYYHNQYMLHQQGDEKSDAAIGFDQRAYEKLAALLQGQQLDGLKQAMFSEEEQQQVPEFNLRDLDEDAEEQLKDSIKFASLLE